MYTIDNIMKLHDEAAEKRHINGAPVYNAVAAHAREALRAALTEFASTATEYQQAADKMAMVHKVERDRWIPMFDALQAENHTLSQQLAEAQVQCKKLEQELDAFDKSENSFMRKAIELEALIEASRKQEPVAWLITAAGTKRKEVQLCKPYRLLTSERVRPLYASPKVAPDVLKDAEHMQWLDKNTTFMDIKKENPVALPNLPVLAAVSSRIWYHATDDITSYPLSAVIDAAMGGANE